MTVILIFNSKGKWLRKGKELVSDGTTFDGWDKMEYILDLWIEIMKGGKTFSIRKSRIESLPQGGSMPLSYPAFADVYGKDIMEAETKPANLATAEQLVIVKELVVALNVDDDQIAKWFKKVDVSEWEEMTSVQIEGVTVMLKKKVEGIKK